MAAPTACSKNLRGLPQRPASPSAVNETLPVGVAAFHGMSMTPDKISKWLDHLNVDEAIAGKLGVFGSILYICILALIANFLAKRLIAWAVHPIIKKTAIK